MATALSWVLGILLALPVWFLCGALIYLMGRLFYQWLVNDGSAPATAKPQNNPNTTLKG